MMALFSCSNLLRILSIFHLTLAYYLFTAPILLTEQNLVLILGAAMDFPRPSEALSVPNSATGLAALFLITISVMDLTAPSVENEIGSAYWSTQAPLRVALYFAITAGVYFGKFGLEQTKSTARLTGNASFMTIREVVCNSFVFTWAFLEMMLWFWVGSADILYILAHDSLIIFRSIRQCERREESS